MSGSPVINPDDDTVQDALADERDDFALAEAIREGRETKETSRADAFEILEK